MNGYAPIGHGVRDWRVHSSEREGAAIECPQLHSQRRRAAVPRSSLTQAWRVMPVRRSASVHSRAATCSSRPRLDTAAGAGRPIRPKRGP